MIIDVGGCWGWHWRNIDIQKKNIRIVIIDLVRHNLFHAKQVLKPLIDSGNVLLIHGNATELPFPDYTFDGYWTVQTLQHIPIIEKAVKEAHRVLKQNGLFINYSLNNSLFMRLVYKLSKRNYHVNGNIEGRYFLRRSTPKDAQIVAKVFDNVVEITFSEIIFQLEFKTTFSGKMGSFFGRVDSSLTTKNKFAGLFARQISFSTRKK
jgi:ubiquinone/menaquinone biosynthesis C-methylase UbiE